MQNHPPIALGTWSWGAGFAGGDQVFGNHLDAGQMQQVFDKSMEMGLNLWDTAAVYGMGASENALAQAIGKRRSEVILSTKFTPQIADAAAANPVEAMLADSLKRLNTDYIDIYWIHNPHDIERWTPLLIPLLRSGRIKAVGVSNHNLAQIRRAGEILGAAGQRIAAVQNHYSLLYRSSERAGILEYCRQNDMRFFAYMVLEQGALSGRYTPDNPLPAGSQRAATYNPVLPQLARLTDALRDTGAKHGLSAAQTAIAWAIAKGTLPLIGATKASHVQEAAQAAAVSLAPGETAALEHLAEAAGIDTRGAWEADMTA